MVLNNLYGLIRKKNMKNLIFNLRKLILNNNKILNKQIKVA